MPGWVLVEADSEELTSSGIIVPITDRYPNSGTVLAVGRTPHDIRVGDFVIVPDEGTLIGNTYWHACFLIFHEYEEKVHCDADCEPVIREAVERYRRAPTTEDKTLVLKSHDGDSVSFLASDVKDYGLEDISTPEVRLECVPVVMMRAWWNGKERLYYWVRAEEILLPLRSE